MIALMVLYRMLAFSISWARFLRRGAGCVATSDTGRLLLLSFARARGPLELTTKRFSARFARQDLSVGEGGVHAGAGVTATIGLCSSDTSAEVLVDAVDGTG